MRLTPLIFAAASFATSGSANAQQLGGGGSPGPSLARIVAAFVLCIVAAVAVTLVMRQRNSASKSNTRLSLSHLLPNGLTGVRRIEVIETRRISLHADLCCVRYDGTEYLLLCSASGHEVLSRQTLPSLPNVGIDD